MTLGFHVNRMLLLQQFVISMVFYFGSKFAQQLPIETMEKEQFWVESHSFWPRTTVHSPDSWITFSHKVNALQVELSFSSFSLSASSPSSSAYTILSCKTWKIRWTLTLHTSWFACSLACECVMFDTTNFLDQLILPSFTFMPIDMYTTHTNLFRINKIITNKITTPYSENSN